MANQPKKYKKFVATAATATLVASAIVPVASAAENNFTDISNYSADVQEAINALVEEGVINATSDTFNPGAAITRGQVVKMLGKLVEQGGFELPEDWNTEARFTDLAVNAKDQELVKYAAIVADAGVFTGNNGVLNASGKITRENMALVLNRAYEAITGTSLVELADGIENQEVSDLATAKAEAQDTIQALKNLGITTPANFNPKGDVTRANFAAFLYRAVSVDVEAPVEDAELTVKSVSAITSTGVTVAIDAPTEDLKDVIVTVKDGNGKTYAVNAASIKAGATTATFNFVTPLTVSPTSAWTVNGVAYKVSDLAIVAVESIDSNNKNLVVEFNKPVTSLDASEITIREKVAQTRSGVASVKLAADGMSAQVTLVGFGDASVNGLDTKTVYTLSITKNGSVISSDFEIPGVYEDAVVKNVNSTNRTITVAPKNTAGLYAGAITVNVPADLAFDFQEALGRDLTVWTDKNNKVTKFAYNDETVIYDAIKYETKTIAGVPTTVVKTVTDGKTYEIATGGKVGLQDTNRNGALDQTIGNKDNYAKVVLGTDGKAKTIIAFDLDNAILVDKVENETVSGFGLAASLKDYTIVKGGKTVTVADIKAGDAVYYNTAKKYAEVYNNKVEGKISAFFNNEIQLQGKSYDIRNAQGIIDNKFVNLTNDNVAAFTNVTAYLDRAGQLELLTGERSEAASATTVAFAKEDLSTFDYKGTTFLKVVTQKADGKAVTEEVDATKLKSIKGVTSSLTGIGTAFTTLQTGNLTAAQTASGTVVKVTGFFYAVDKDDSQLKLFAAKNGTTVSAAKTDVETTNGSALSTVAYVVTLPSIAEDVIEVTKQDDVVTGLDFLGNGTAVDNASGEIKLTDKALSTSNGTGPSYQLKSSVPVFIIDTLAAGQTTQTYTSTTWGALDPNISKILEDNAAGHTGEEFTVYNDGKGNAKYIVLNQGLIQAPDANNKFENVISEVKYGTQTTPEIAYIKFAGDDKQYTVAKETGLHTTALVVGEVLNVEAKDSAVVTFTQETTGTTNAVGVYSATNAEIADGTFTITEADGTVTAGYSLASSGAKVYEVTGSGLTTKLEERTYADLANLKANQYIEASLIAAGSKKVDAIVIRTDNTAPNVVAAANIVLTDNTATSDATTADTLLLKADGTLATTAWANSDLVAGDKVKLTLTTPTGLVEYTHTLTASNLTNLTGSTDVTISITGAVDAAITPTNALKVELVDTFGNAVVIPGVTIVAN